MRHARACGSSGKVTPDQVFFSIAGYSLSGFHGIGHQI
jgi:hypothetical protein